MDTMQKCGFEVEGVSPLAKDDAQRDSRCQHYFPGVQLVEHFEDARDDGSCRQRKPK